MSNIDTGGPAFPTNDVCYNGMSLRDYFAAKAMQAATSGHIGHYGHESNHWQVNDIASYAYEMADAMMKARNKE
jgi:hypothetical protein